MLVASAMHATLIILRQYYFMSMCLICCLFVFWWVFGWFWQQAQCMLPLSLYVNIILCRVSHVAGSMGRFQFGNMRNARYPYYFTSILFYVYVSYLLLVCFLVGFWLVLAASAMQAALITLCLYYYFMSR